MSGAILAVKIGDQITSPTKPYAGARDGCPSDLIWLEDEQHGGRDWRNVVHEHTLKTYACFAVDPADREAWIALCRPRGTVEDGAAYRPAMGWLDPFGLAKLLGYDEKLVDEWRGAGAVDVLDGTKIKPTDFKPSTNRPATASLEDLNAISAGNYSLGSGKDYTTLRLFCDDVTNLTGDLTGSVQTNLTETQGNTPTWTIGNAGRKFTLTADINHGGVKGAGRKISSSQNVPLLHFQIEGPGQAYVTLLEFLQTASALSYSFIKTSTVSAAWTLNLQRLIMNCNGNLHNAWEFFDTEVAVRAYLCALQNGATYNLYCRTLPSPLDAIFENCVFRDAGSYNVHVNGQRATFRSCYAGGTAASDFGGNLSLSNAYACTSSDLTANSESWALKGDAETELLPASAFSDSTWQIAIDSDLHTNEGATPTLGFATMINGVAVPASLSDRGVWGAEDLSGGMPPMNF
jgi:hypothetical protein